MTASLVDRHLTPEEQRAALEHDGPVLLDVRVAREENCYPMIPPGNAARDMVESPQKAVG